MTCIAGTSLLLRTTVARIRSGFSSSAEAGAVIARFLRYALGELARALRIYLAWLELAVCIHLLVAFSAQALLDAVIPRHNCVVGMGVDTGDLLALLLARGRLPRPAVISLLGRDALQLGGGD